MTTDEFCPPVIPGTYNGRVTVNGQPAADGTEIRAMIDDVEWGSTVTSGGRYVVDVPQRPPIRPPCFLGGVVTFESSGLTATESPPWSSGLNYLDLTFGGVPVASGRPPGRGATVGAMDVTHVLDFTIRVRQRQDDAQRYYESQKFTEAVSAVQEALELLVKAMFLVAGLRYPRGHKLVQEKNKGDLAKVVEELPKVLTEAVPLFDYLKQNYPANMSPRVMSELNVLLRDRGILQDVLDTEGSIVLSVLAPVTHMEIKRAIFMADFWGNFYTSAKYGDEVLETPPSALLGDYEAALAIRHLGGCRRILFQMYLAIIQRLLPAAMGP